MKPKSLILFLKFHILNNGRWEFDSYSFEELTVQGAFLRKRCRHIHFRAKFEFAGSSICCLICFETGYGVEIIRKGGALHMKLII